MTVLRALRVLIVAGDALARAGLAANLAQQPGVSVVGQIGLSADISPDIEAYRPDVMVWDLAWDPSTALDSLASLSDDAPPVLALMPDETNATRAWSTGARGLILRDAGPDQIVSALAALDQGLTVLDPSLSSGIPGGRGLPAESAQLTPRESQALRLLADGLTNKAIADRMGISENTVKFHVNGVLGKLNAQSRAEAVAQAARMGLIPL